MFHFSSKKRNKNYISGGECNFCSIETLKYITKMEQQRSPSIRRSDHSLGNPPIQPTTRPTVDPAIYSPGRRFVDPASAHSAVLVQHGLNAFLHDGNDVIQSFRA